MMLAMVSVYFPKTTNDSVLTQAFLITALEEATDINKYLRALRPFVEKLSGTGDFNELTQMFPPLMHTIILVWKNSKFYNTATKITVLLQETCNDIIEQARSFIQPSELFSNEPEEAAERIKTVMKVCQQFKDTYAEYKAKTVDTERPWNFDSKLVFSRLDKFLLRVENIMELFDTIIEFNKLEKVEIGGTKVRSILKGLHI